MKQPNNRVLQAAETMQILQAGGYLLNNEQVSIKAAVESAIANSLLYRPNEFEPVVESAAQKLSTLQYSTRMVVQNCTVLEAAAEMAQSPGAIGCLNFASAKNPGGGFLGGAQAQEESIARASALYPTLLPHKEMYEYNKKQHTYLYSDYMIYSPAVPVFRNDAGDMIQPFSLSVLTSPAPNATAMRNNKPSELALAENVFMQRMDKVLALFVHHGYSRLLLGAWGCGVFGNSAEDVARYWTHFLLPGGKYAHCFSEIVFAVYDRSATKQNVQPFTNIFG